MALKPDVERYLVRVVVDTHLHLPDMFELTFFDEGGDLVDQAGLSIGTPVEISGGAADSTEAKKLIAGEDLGRSDPGGPVRGARRRGRGQPPGRHARRHGRPVHPRTARPPGVDDS